MKRINITFEVEDHLEQKAIDVVYNALGEDKIKDLRVFQNTDHLINDSEYKRLKKAKKDATVMLDMYVIRNKPKQ